MVTGVSAHRELLERAVDAGAQLVLAHHGLFWDFLPARAQRADGRRGCGSRSSADLSVAGYHLPLDAHPEIGNNALLCAGLGFELEAGPFAEVKGPRDRGDRRAAEGRSRRTSCSARVARRRSAASRSSSRPGRRGCARSASSPARRPRARRRGGRRSASTRSSPASRPSTRWPTPARAGIHFIAAGHYATETLGIRRLGELVAERFGVEHEFIDVPNPI